MSAPFAALTAVVCFMVYGRHDVRETALAPHRDSMAAKTGVHAEARYLAGRIAAANGDAEAAGRAYTAALELEPGANRLLGALRGRRG